MFHYPSEVFDLVVECIVHVKTSKQGVIDFLRGAGVPDSLLAPWRQRVREDRNSVRMSEIARDVLRLINEGGDAYIRARREIIRQLVEWEDFSRCYPDKRDSAEANVGRLRQAVNRKDAFTRLSQERERDAAHNRAEREHRLQQAAARESRRQDLIRLFGIVVSMTDPWKRGKALESALNQLFEFYGILVRDAFTVRGNAGEGTVEQIDGVIEIDGRLYLVEMKWHSEPLGVNEVSRHQVNVFSRPSAGGILISASGFGPPAVASIREFLAHKLVCLCGLGDFVLALDRDIDIRAMLKRKLQRVEMDKQPLQAGVE